MSWFNVTNVATWQLSWPNDECIRWKTNPMYHTNQWWLINSFHRKTFKRKYVKRLLPPLKHSLLKLIVQGGCRHHDREWNDITKHMTFCPKIAPRGSRWGSKSRSRRAEGPFWDVWQLLTRTNAAIILELNTLIWWHHNIYLGPSPRAREILQILHLSLKIVPIIIKHL